MNFNSDLRKKLGFLGLMGGDEFSKNCIEMDEWIINELDRKNPLISILPTASTNQKPGLAISNAMNYFDAFGAKVESVPIYSREDSNNSNIVDKLRNADLVYIIGGDPFYLSKVIKESYCEDVLKDLLGLGKSIVGSSAGAMFLGSIFLKDIFKCTVIPHFENSLHLQKLVQGADDTTILGIDSATGIFTTNSGWKVLGEKCVHYISSGIVKSFSKNQYIK